MSATRADALDYESLADAWVCSDPFRDGSKRSHHPRSQQAILSLLASGTIAGLRKVLSPEESRRVIERVAKGPPFHPGSHTQPPGRAETTDTAHQGTRPAADDGVSLTERYGIVRASTIAEQPTEWEWPGYLVRGALNLVEGNPETGKTLFVVTVTANLSAGRPLPFGAADPKRRRRVLYLTAEDSIARTIIGRLKAAGADLEHVLVQKERGADLAFAGSGIDDIRQIVRGEGIGKIVLDPLNAYLEGVDINKEMEVRGALRPIRDFAEDENVTITGLRHLNKATDKPALYRGGGSIALTAVARSTLLVARHPDDSTLRVLLSQKCNLIEEEKRPPLGFRIVKTSEGRPRIEWMNERMDVSADELLAPQKPGPKADALEHAKQFITDFLAGGPKPRTHVLEAGKKVHLNERTMERARGALNVRSTAQGRERLWSLP